VRANDPEEIDLRSFSAIEFAILLDIAGGYQSKEIAGRIGRSKATVENYVRLLCAKLGARSRAHMISLAYARGLLPVSDGSVSA